MATRILRSFIRYAKKKMCLSVSVDEEDGAIWRKKILMGSKCKPLDFSGVIHYDEHGNRLPFTSQNSTVVPVAPASSTRITDELTIGSSEASHGHACRDVAAAAMTSMDQVLEDSLMAKNIEHARVATAVKSYPHLLSDGKLKETLHDLLCKEREMKEDGTYSKDGKDVITQVVGKGRHHGGRTRLASCVLGVRKTLHLGKRKKKSGVVERDTIQRDQNSFVATVQASSVIRQPEIEVANKLNPNGVGVQLGSKDYARVQLSRRRFVEQQAETWLSENYEKVCERYDVRGSNKSSVSSDVMGADIGLQTGKTVVELAKTGKNLVENFEKIVKIIENLRKEPPENPSWIRHWLPAFKLRNDKEVETDCTAQQQGREKRTTKLTSAYKSPYVKRKVELGQKLSDDENMIAEYIFSPIDELNFVYKSIYGTESFKVIFESLYEGVKLVSNIIDIWSEVLNDEEKLKSRMSPRRFFCSTFISLEEHFKLTDEKQYDKFKSNMDQYLNQFKVKSLLDIDLLFFPILASGHFYVLCFHLKVGKIVLMDNSKMGYNFDDRYKGIPQKLRNALCNYMKLSKIRTGLKKLKVANITRLTMPWRTAKNKIDCGVFTMRHMETYMGNDKWDCGFSEKEDAQQEQVKELRYKFLSKMLLSGINTARNGLITDALKFQDKETELKDAMRKNLIDKIKERQSNFI